jgi:hypothetical protein
MQRCVSLNYLGDLIRLILHQIMHSAASTGLGNAESGGNNETRFTTGAGRTAKLGEFLDSRFSQSF